MNIDLTDNIYQDLNEYISRKTNYDVRIIKKALKQSDKFPLITLVEENNIFKSGTLKYDTREIVDSIFWEVNIYSTDISSDDGMISNLEICEELKVLVDDIMTRKYKLRRTSCRPTPNLDNTIYRITMRYNCDLLTNRKRII